MELLASEIRVLGCLIEKQRTTPDQYPLTLNALRLACNQSTNRDPVVEYDEAVVRDALHRLERQGLVRFAGGAGSRAPKFRHLLADAMPLEDPQQAAMCVLMLRGPQTPGEIKQRGERLHPFAGIEEVDDTLESLIQKGLVRRLSRARGQKEERYVQTLGGEGEAAAPAHPAHAPVPPAHSPVAPETPPSTAERLDREQSAQIQSLSEPVGADAAELRRLSERVRALERELQAVKAELGIDVRRPTQEAAKAGVEVSS